MMCRAAQLMTIQTMMADKNVMLSICIQWLNVQLVVIRSYSKATAAIVAS